MEAKKSIAREVLWFLAAVVVAIPLSFLFLSCIDIVSKNDTFSRIEKIFIFELFLLGFIVNFVGIYIVRIIITAFRTLTK